MVGGRGNNMNARTVDSSEESISFRELLIRLWQGRWWVIVSTLVVTGIATVMAFLATPIFRATTVMVSASSDRISIGSTLSSALGSLGGLASLAGFGFGSGDSQTEEALAVLRSQQFNERFISDLNLLPIIFENMWDKEQRSWNVKPDDQPTLSMGFKVFDVSIRKINVDKKTGLISVQIEWKDRFATAAWSAGLVQRINAEMRARAIAKAEASVGFLQRELNNTTDIGTRDAINRLIEAQIKQRMLATVTDEYSFRVVDKAFVPGPKDKVRPSKRVYVMLGFLLGGVLGCLAALAARNWRKPAPV
jgi:uncharacterized protein involved in exopolysaccharide biosynthesis